jgi:small-conductance mechanosensitive channel
MDQSGALRAASVRAGSDISHLVREHTDVLVARPLRILLIITIAFIVRLVAHRFIDRVTRATAQGHVPSALRPLKESAVTAHVLEASPLQSERRRQRAQTVGSVLKSAVSVILFILTLLMVLGQFDIDLAPLIAGTTVVGAALAFGAQGVIQDFLAGMFMILEDQYGVGDVIDVKETTGTVEAVGLRTTRLRDAAGTVWYVRNGTVVRVGNQSQGNAQLAIDMPIPPGASLTDSSRLMLDVATQMSTEDQWESAFIGPPTMAGVESIGREESVVRLNATVRPADQWRVARELRRRIRERLDPADGET